VKTRRVLVVTPSGKNLGGSERMLVQFLASARHAGIVVHVVFLENGDHFEDIARAGYSCECIPAGRLRYIHRWIGFFFVLAGILRLHRPDMVIGWQSKTSCYASLPCWFTRTPFFCFHRGYPGSSWIDRASYFLHSSGYVANSRFTAARLSRFVRRPIAVIHSTVDIEAFTKAKSTPPAELKQKLGFDPDKPLVGIVGRLQHWKGMHVFVHAMALVRESIDCQAVIVGGTHDFEPDYPAFLEEKIYSLGMKGHVRMVGTQTNTSEWMQAMDVFVHASEHEPFGIVVVEAMSLGKPVIATAPGGPEEIITHDENGQLVAFNDPKALAHAIERYLKDSVLAGQHGNRATTTARNYDGLNYAPTLLEKIDALKVREWRKSRRN